MKTPKKLKTMFNVAAALLMVAMFSFPQNTFAQTKSKTVTIKGEVLDMSCYIAGGKHGPKHKSCAAMCIKGGAPIGLLTKDGKVYLLVNDEKNKAPFNSLKNHAADIVTVTGKLYDRHGMNGIVVESVKAKS